MTGIDDTKSDPTTSSTTTAPTGTTTTTPTATTTSTTETPSTCNAPENHRAAPKACDGTRPLEPVSLPPGSTHPHVKCTTHEECTAGKNGRCLGNNHDGWQCTYDACETDADCSGGAKLCECEGGFRSDHNVCLTAECHVDADCAPTSAACGTGFCSPSLGSCGHYTKAVGYFCHTAKDECTNDSDCEGRGQFGQKPYCKFEPSVGFWKCSTQECAG